MDASFIEQASAGLSTAQIIVMCYMAFSQQSVDKRLGSVERKTSRILNRLQVLSTKAGLDEVDATD